MRIIVLQSKGVMRIGQICTGPVAQQNAVVIQLIVVSDGPVIGRSGLRGGVRSSSPTTSTKDINVVVLVAEVRLAQNVPHREEQLCVADRLDEVRGTH